MKKSRIQSADLAPDDLVRQLTDKSRARRESLQAIAKAVPLGSPPRNDLTPEFCIERRQIDALKQLSQKTRKHDPEQLAQIRSSFLQFGYAAPVIITPDGRVINGEAVIEAARDLGIAELRCVVIGHLTRSEARRLRITLNRLSEKAQWDLEELRIELQELFIEDEGLVEIPGFDAAEIDGILLDDAGADLGAVERVLPPQGPAITRLGDAWSLGEHHRLICGDARDGGMLAMLARDRKVRAILTDPPYAVAIKGHVTSGAHREFVMGGAEMSATEFLTFLSQCFEAMVPVLIEGGLCLSFIDWRGFATLTQAAERAGLHLINLVVWAKTNAGMGSLYRSQHELLPVFKKGTATHVNNVQLGRKGRWRSNLWTYPGASSLGSDAREGLKVHPTVKPVAMLEDSLLDLTNRGDIVLDPFAGSGSTIIAAERTGRVCYAAELDPLYCDVILRRWLEATGVSPVLAGTGENFAAVSASRLAVSP